MNNENKYELIKFEDGDFSLDVNVSPIEDTVWLTQEQIAELYGKARNTISEHISKIFKENEFSTRRYYRMIRLARTIADLEECEMIRKEHIAEAYQYCNIGKKYWKAV